MRKNEISFLAATKIDIKEDIIVRTLSRFIQFL